MTRLVCSLALAACLLLAACGTTATTPSPGPPPGPPGANPLPPAEAYDPETGWQAAARVPATAPSPRWAVDLASGARVGEDRLGGGGTTPLVVVTPSGPVSRVERLDPATGRPLWGVVVPVAEPQQPEIVGGVAPVVALESGAGTGFVVLDAADGRLVVQRPGPPPITFRATPDLVLLEDSDTVAVDRATGAERWRSTSTAEVQPGGLRIEDFTASGRVRGVLDPATGRPRWARPDPPFSDGTLAGDLYVSSLDGDVDTVTAADPATGGVRWSVPVRGDVGRADVVRIDQDTLVLTPGGSPGAQDGSAVALSAADGRVLWSTGGVPDGPPEAVRSEDRVGLVLRDTVLDGRTGALRPLGGLSGRVSGGVSYAADLGQVNGRVRALGVTEPREVWSVAVDGPGELRRAYPVPDGFVAGLSTGDLGLTDRLVGYLG